ncbi:MarR family winged helix-turn-helix transcriptional regulator [Ideonella alba]|uniref:MarR family winged helix-turn-helix transcriptional regulator n=1 Tax=Ideonella alba TaxID=2824118 RepID=UPI002872DF4A|nr:MarR family transcriptional regulator [Ideonella alba]
MVRLLEGRYGIARREWRLLALLAARGPMSPSALAEAAQLDRPRTSRAAGVLAAKGLVQRQAQSGDARRAVLTLTESGHQLHDDLFPQIAAINARLVAVLDDAQLAVLDQALAQLTAHARQLNTELAQDVRADRRAGGSRRIRP